MWKGGDNLCNTVCLDMRLESHFFNKQAHTTIEIS